MKITMINPTLPPDSSNLETFKAVRTFKEKYMYLISFYKIFVIQFQQQVTLINQHFKNK